MKRALSFALAALLAIGLVACSGDTSSISGPGSEGSAPPPESQAQVSNTGTETPGGEIDAGVSIDQLTLGVDYTDLSADIKFLSNRTDLVDSTFQDYVAGFQEMYPNINVTYEAMTNYEEDMVSRISTPDWGDACMIPRFIPVTEMPDYFEPFGAAGSLSATYNFMSWTQNGTDVYGMPALVNVMGVVYNKAVFEQAGITDLPTTPGEFLDALQAIKDNTDAIPLYTNFAAGWTMGAWDYYISGNATGDADYLNVELPHEENPFTDCGNDTGPYAVYNILYEAVSRGLTEDDPTTTDWEGCKPMINNGEIGVLVLGSWAISQMQEAGPNAEDIGYMPFPITVNGKQYLTVQPDYCYGINKNSSPEKILASKLYIKYLIEESQFGYVNGGAALMVGGDFPPSLSEVASFEMVPDNPPKAGEEELFDNINVDSEIGINSDNQHVMDIVEAALTGSKTMDDLADEWNARWGAAQEKYSG